MTLDAWCSLEDAADSLPLADRRRTWRAHGLVWLHRWMCDVQTGRELRTSDEDVQARLAVCLRRYSECSAAESTRRALDVWTAYRRCGQPSRPAVLPVDMDPLVWLGTGKGWAVRGAI